MLVHCKGPQQRVQTPAGVKNGDVFAFWFTATVKSIYHHFITMHDRKAGQNLRGVKDREMHSRRCRLMSKLSVKGN